SCSLLLLLASSRPSIAPRVLFVRFFFFFQAEDGIRDATVTGVQTCALPIFPARPRRRRRPRRRAGTGPRRSHREQSAVPAERPRRGPRAGDPVSRAPPGAGRRRRWARGPPADRRVHT